MRRLGSARSGAAKASAAVTVLTACGLFGGSAAPLLDASLEERDGPVIQIQVDVREPASGRLTVEMGIAGLEASSFVQLGKQEEVRIDAPTFWDEAGAEIPYEREGRRFELRRAPGSVVRLRYEAVPGGPGRHGYQGMVASDFASFDGRVFLLPEDAPRLRRARLRLRRPPGWIVASPFRVEGDALVVETLGSDLVADALAHSCLAVGPYDARVRPMGETEVRVFSHASWDEAHRERLAQKTFRVIEWFHRELGFDLRAPFAVVWSPQVDEERVFGGAYSNGTCMEHPEERLRNFELLAHRVAHAMNKYPPSGMELRDTRDRWFREGWASYVEIESTRASGVAPDASRFDRLYRMYELLRRASPEHDLALAQEPGARGESVEFLHYTKGPLVVKMLDHWLRARSGRSLEEFMAGMWARYGRFSGPLPLREELASFAGFDLDPFWSAMVDVPGRVFPVWQEALASPVGSEPEEPVGEIGGEPVPADYLLYLLRSGDFDRYAAVEAFLVAESRHRARLQERGVRVGYPDFDRPRASLAPLQRYALALREAEVARATGSAPESAGPEAGRGLELRLDPHAPQARTFATLLEKELAYERSRGVASGMAWLRMRPGGRAPALVVDPEESLLVEVAWIRPPGPVRAELVHEGRVVSAQELPPNPGEMGRRVRFPPEDRPATDLVEVRLVEGQRTLIRRVFWQHAED